MLVVSSEVFEMLCHPERKPMRKLKAKDLVARDTFTGETMNLEIPNEPFPDEIAAHECGHVVALAAAGLAGRCRTRSMSSCSRCLKKNTSLFRKIYDALVERKTLDRASLGPDILREMETCASRSKEDYGKLLVWFRQWHASMPKLF